MNKTMKTLVFTVSCSLALSGCGAREVPDDLWGGTELDFEQTTHRAMVTKKGTDDKAEIRFIPAAWTDGTFYLSEGQVALLSAVIKGKSEHWEEFKKIEAEDRRSRFVKKPAEYRMLLDLTLPAGVELADVADGEVLKTEPADGGTHYTIALIADFDMTFSRMKDDFNWWRQIGFIVRSTGKAGDAFRGATISMRWDDVRFTNVETVDFKVMPAIPETPKFKQFYYGCSTGGIYPDFAHGGWDLWTKMIVGCGLNAMQPDLRNEKIKKEKIATLRRNGVELLTPCPFGCSVYNGYVVGSGKDIPADERFVSDPDLLAKDGPAAKREIEGAVCPSSVYERMPYYRTKTLPLMRETFAGYDGIWCNWEPFAFFGRGCFCDRCRAKFAAFVKVPEAEIAKGWPKEEERGGKRYREFIKFSSVEHGKLMKALREDVASVCGGENCKAGFIPGVAWCEMASMWRTSDYAKEARPYDYAKGFKWISPWGPYAIYPAEDPYVYSKWRNLRTFLAAKDVRMQVNKDYASAERPKIMAYPHGMQSPAWFCYPEALEMNIDSFFFNGWEAVSVYHFPRGYDQRWLAAFARSGAKAAKYEDIVFNGTRDDARAKLELTAPYAAPNSHEGTATRGLEIKGQPMLQHVVYEKDGKTVVAVFNFWEKGPAFFRLTLDGKDMGEFYCGALRTRVWEFGKGAEPRGFTDADVAGWRAKLMPKLLAAKRADEKFEHDFGDREYTLKDMAIGATAAKANVFEEKLVFTSGDRELTLDCKKMAFVSWKKGGVEQLKQPLGFLSFADPAAGLEGRSYRVENQYESGKSFGIAATLKLKAADHARLDLLQAGKRIYVDDGLKSVTVIAALANRSTDEQPRDFEVAPKLSDGGLPAKSIVRKGPAGVGKDGAFNMREISIGATVDFVLKATLP